jgi:hypothetical protein
VVRPLWEKLKKKKKRRRLSGRAPQLTVAQILVWADAYYARTGRWPTANSGKIPGSLGDTWLRVNAALRVGTRGLEGGSSLAQLLAQHRGYAYKTEFPPLTEEDILAWADAHRQRTGEWPTSRSGKIPEAALENWSNVDQVLRKGGRGLPGGSSLARLLADKRGARNVTNLPRLSVKQILVWADAHRRQTGEWPTLDSGKIIGTEGETWSGVNQALQGGYRGLPGGSSLARLLAQKRGHRSKAYLPPLDVEQILAWADAYHERTGEWPNLYAGDIPEAPGETWMNIDAALRHGCRGLPGGATLAALLAQYRGVRNRGDLPPLSEADILAWADAHHQRTGEWPTSRSGPIPEAPGETWQGVDAALRGGYRGQAGGSSLARLLRKKRGVQRVPPLTIPQILAWVDSHHERTGHWPRATSGPIEEAPGETWMAVHLALSRGTRNLPGGSSLARLLAAERGVRNRKDAPRLTIPHIRAWARAHRQRTGKWPIVWSGPILEAPGETWQAVNSALRVGGRGLPGGSSLHQLLAPWKETSSRHSSRLSR